MNVVNNHDLYYQATYTGSTLCDALNETFGLELDKEYYQPKELNKKIKKYQIRYSIQHFKKSENPLIPMGSTLFSYLTVKDGIVNLQI